MTTELTTRSDGRVIVCFHFQQKHYVVKLFTFKLGDLKVHLCAECAEQLSKGLAEQLEADRHGT